MTPLRTAMTIPDAESEGPGRRFATWVQGCPLHCPGCCNPEMFSSEGGTATTPDALLAQILGTPGIEGITLLGGEPFAQAEGCAELASKVRAAGLSVMVFSGYTLAELRERGLHAASLLASTDLLVDGRYVREQPEPAGGRRWIGSQNQVMHFLTDRYRKDDPRFASANTVELRLSRGALSVIGWPAGAQRLRSGR